MIASGDNVKLYRPGENVRIAVVSNINVYGRIAYVEGQPYYVWDGRSVNNFNDDADRVEELNEIERELFA